MSQLCSFLSMNIIPVSCLMCKYLQFRNSCRWNYKVLYSHSQLSLQCWHFTNHYWPTCVMFCWFILFTCILMVICSIFSLSYSSLIRAKVYWQGLLPAQDQQMKVIGWESWPEGREEEILSTWLSCPNLSPGKLWIRENCNINEKLRLTPGKKKSLFFFQLPLYFSFRKYFAYFRILITGGIEISTPGHYLGFDI